MESDFYGHPRDELKEVFQQRLNQKGYRVDQVFDWAYRKGITSFLEMTNLSEDLRESLLGQYCLSQAKEIERQISSDGTRKYLLEVSPGRTVETVMIKQESRMTLCLSSQVGCAMACTFCATGTMGLQANLATGDIIRQVLHVNKDCENFGDQIDNIVFMGMGEPLHNYKNVVKAIKILTDVLGLGIGPRKITVSSVGLVPAIERFGREDLKVNLAISLNATSDDVRSQIMPVNRRFPIKRLLACLRDYPLSARKKITIEYVMLHGLNDTDADLKRLRHLMKGLPVKINLIPYNENVGLGYQRPPKATILKWQNGLSDQGFVTTIRWSKGIDIAAACGQLAAKSEGLN